MKSIGDANAFRGWLPCNRCGRRTVRLRGKAVVIIVTENRRWPVPFPDNVAEVAPGASIDYTFPVTVTCPRGHVMIFRHQGGPW